MRGGAPTDALRMRARVLLRVHARAAVAVGVLAGLAGGGVLALFTMAKDTDRSLTSYVDGLGDPDGFAIFCPPGVSAGGGEGECVRYDPVRELARLRAHPDVVGAVRMAFAPVFVRLPGGPWQAMMGIVAPDGGNPFGSPPVIAGRMADTAKAEATVNESFLERFGFGAGSAVEVAPVTWEEFAGSAIPSAPSTEPITLTVTAVLRTPPDLSAAVGDDVGGTGVQEAGIFLGASWSTQAPDHARFGQGIAFHVVDGADAESAIAAAAPGQQGNFFGSLSDLDAVARALDYESRAAAAAAGTAAVAALALVGVVVARQARRELEDVAPLRALGATRAFVTVAAVPRWSLSAAVGLVVAAVTAAVLRPVGPIGLGRKLIASPGVSLDPSLAVPVLGVVVVAILTLGLGATLTGLGHRGRPPLKPSGLPALPLAPATIGLSLGGASSRRWVSVAPIVAVVAVAAAAGAASAGVLASLRHLTAEPARFGVTWDATVSMSFSGNEEGIVERLQAIPGIEAVAGLRGGNGTMGGSEIYAYAFEPVAGLPEGIVPAVVRGRPPGAPGEVALGALTMDAANVDLGETVVFDYLGSDHELTVVGEVLINDNTETLPGKGAIVDHRWLAEVDREATASDFAVRFAPGREVAGLAELEAAFPRNVTPPVRQAGIRNLDRIDRWPMLLTALLAGLCLATFVHLVVLTARRQRHQLAVLKALGFSRAQTSASVVWFGVFVAVPAAIIGVLIGVPVGRWGWGVFASDLGVPAVPRVPVLTLTLIALVTLGVAVLASAPVAWGAGRVSTARALRTE